MKICQVSFGLSPISSQDIDASNSVIRNLTNQFISMGHSVDILSPMDTNIDDQPFHIVPIPIPKIISNSGLLKEAYYSISSAIFFLSKMKRDDYDIIHFHGPAVASLCAIVARIYGIPTIYTTHNPNLTVDLKIECNNKIMLFKELNESHLPFLNSICSIYSERFAFKTVDKIVAVSNTQRDNIIKYFSVNPSRIEYIPNGIDTKMFNLNFDHSHLMKLHNLKNEKIVLCLARLAPYKNQLTLVKSILHILDFSDNIRFIFVGPISKPFLEYYNEIGRFIDSHNLKKYVIFTGSVNSSLIPAYYSLADIVVLPSLSEGMPLVLLEAMGCGKAIVASSIEPNLELAKNGSEMLFVDPSNPQEISASIIKILRDEELKGSLEISSRNTVVEYFDWTNIARKTLSLYNELKKPRS